MLQPTDLDIIMGFVAPADIGRRRGGNTTLHVNEYVVCFKNRLHVILYVLFYGRGAHASLALKSIIIHQRNI